MLFKLFKLSDFEEELLHKDNYLSAHHDGIHTLVTEMYKVAIGLSPEIMNEVYKQRNNSHCNLRHASQFSLIQFIVFIMVLTQYHVRGE